MSKSHNIITIVCQMCQLLALYTIKLCDSSFQQNGDIIEKISMTTDQLLLSALLALNRRY